MSTIKLETKGPHDFYMTFDVGEYFEHEYEFEEIMEGGFARPLRLAQRDVLVVSTFVEDLEGAYFELELPNQDAPNQEEIAEIKTKMSRILGCQIDTAQFAKDLEDDEVVSPLIQKHEGFKRLSRADFYEDALRLIVRTRISHGPTKLKMVKAVRETYGTTFEWRGREYWSYPRPEVLADVDPADLREHSLSLRKAEYITGLAKLVVEKELDLEAMETMPAQEFYDTAKSIRGIGPSSAQFLVMRRDRGDAVFPPKKGEGLASNGMLKWLLPHYGVDVKECTDEEVEAILSKWKGWEAMVANAFYYNWLMAELEKKHQNT